MEPNHIHDLRMDRAEVMDRLKDGSTSLSQALQDAQTYNVISRVRISTLLESIPEIGKTRAREIMDALGIAGPELVRELSAAQQRALRSSTPIQDYEGEDDGYGEDDGDDGDGDGIQPDAAPSEGPSYGIEDWDRS